MWIISLIPFPNTDLLDPVGAAFSDFDVTDLVFSKIRKFNAKSEYGSINDEVTDTSIVIVNIGELDRAALGMLLQQVNKSSPTVVGIDIRFQTPKDPIGDSILAIACAQTKNLILAGDIKYNDTLKIFTAFEKSIPVFSKHGITAYANLITDGDVTEKKTNRTFSPQERINGVNELAFPVELAFFKDSVATNQFLKRNKEVEVINFVGNIDIEEGAKFFAIDFEDVLEGRFAPDLFRNKIVILGFLGKYIGDRDFEDKFYSPLNNKYIGRTDPDIYGVVIHANIINMILTKNYINEVSSTVEFILGIFICYFCVMVLHWFFEKYNLLYGTTSKFVQLGFTFLLLTATVLVFYKFNYKLDLGFGLIGVLLSADLMEIYVEAVEDHYLIIQDKVVVRVKSMNRIFVLSIILLMGIIVLGSFIYAVFFSN
jgi:CHASE2 domain-containing sensor protein